MPPHARRFRAYLHEPASTHSTKNKANYRKRSCEPCPPLHGSPRLVYCNSVFFTQQGTAAAESTPTPASSATTAEAMTATAPSPFVVSTAALIPPIGANFDSDSEDSPRPVVTTTTTKDFPEDAISVDFDSDSPGPQRTTRSSSVPPTAAAAAAGSDAVGFDPGPLPTPKTGVPGITAMKVEFDSDVSSPVRMTALVVTATDTATIAAATTTTAADIDFDSDSSVAEMMAPVAIDPAAAGGVDTGGLDLFSHVPTPAAGVNHGIGADFDIEDSGAPITTTTTPTTTAAPAGGIAAEKDYQGAARSSTRPILREERNHGGGGGKLAATGERQRCRTVCLGGVETDRGLCVSSLSQR